MNLTKFFTKESDVAGLEISDTALSLILLKIKNIDAPSVECYQEERLKEGTLRAGVINNREDFVKSLKSLLSRFDRKIKFLIVTIPADGIYSRVLSFPPGLQGKKLGDSVKLATSFQLPKEYDQIYSDWESVDDEKRNLVLISLSDRARIDDLIKSIESINLKVLAVEYHQMSLARALSLPADQAVLVIEKNSTSLEFSIIKNKTLRFLRQVPLTRLNSTLSDEASRIRDYFEIEDSVIKKIILSGSFNKEEVDSFLALKKDVDISELPATDPVSPVVLGAGLRGLLPRSQDKLISLMESGTEEAYEQEKAIVFIHVLSRFTIVFAIFLTGVFFATWLLAQKMQANFNQQIENYISMPITTDANALEKKAKNFNTQTTLAVRYFQTQTVWSPIISELNNISSSTISLTSLSISSAEQPITLTGVARTRPDLNIFKQALDDSMIFSKANLPLENLDKKIDIPFKITVYLKNPSVAYPKNQ